MDDRPASRPDDAPPDPRRRPSGPPEGLPPPPPTNEAFEGSGVRSGGARSEGGRFEGSPPAPDEFDPRRLRRRGQDPTIDRGIDSREMWRILRITSEIVEALDRLREIRPAITIWGSARLAQDHPHCVRVFETSKRLAEMGYSILTGGGPGIMEAANRGAKAGKGKSVGLGIVLPMEQRINEACDIAIDFDYFFIRKMMFTKFAAGLVVAPGGFGTLDEMFDTLTLIQTGKIRRIPVVMLGKAYFGPLIAWMRSTLVPEGTISPDDLDLWHLTDDPAEAATYLDRHVVDRTWWNGAPTS